MNSNPSELLELAIWKEIAGEVLSVSHDHGHIDRVLDFARQLQAIHGGDLDVITMAVILHDLGRSNPRLHGQESIDKSLEHARRILDRIGLLPDKRQQVLQAISEHDQPDVSPTTLEGRILKDADFLAGFGAWGILRIAMWAGETNGGVDQILHRLDKRMPERLGTMEFPESEYFARQEMQFAQLFIAQLRQKKPLVPRQDGGKYIVLEGISGSGKDTQAELLQAHLEACGHAVVKVAEPADAYRELRHAWESKHGKQLDDPMIMRFLLMADRYELVRNTVLPALQQGQIVISVRSYISTLVYQCSNQKEALETAFHNRFVPLPDMVILLDIDAEVALSRIRDRFKKGIYETPSLLAQHRMRYREVCQLVFPEYVRIINAELALSEVSDRIAGFVDTLFTP
jgi:dTMP kinase